MDAYFEMMQNSIHRLDDTLKEILDYSRNARSELSVAPVDLEKLIADSFEKLRYLPGFDMIRKEVKVAADVPFVSDGYRLSVVFNNLVSNAIKYRDPDKESYVEIDAVITDAALEFVFRDNGIGIGPDVIHRIFDMFYRATEKSEGAGLGLYIVKETIDKMGGSIEVDSKLGEGTAFKVTVPNVIQTAGGQQ